jgi:hypothetical protein
MKSAIAVLALSTLFFGCEALEQELHTEVKETLAPADSLLNKGEQVLKKPANAVEDAFWRNFRTSFMANCTGGDSGGMDISPDKKRAYCQCTLDKFEETYPTMDAALKVAGNQDAILKLAGKCMHHLGVE